MNKQDAIRILGETKLLSPIGQAVYVAIPALKKQIPKKPIEEQEITLSCPHCENANFLTNKDKEKNNYCGNCGQAIDWRYDK